MCWLLNGPRLYLHHSKLVQLVFQVWLFWRLQVLRPRTYNTKNKRKLEWSSRENITHCMIKYKKYFHLVYNYLDFRLAVVWSDNATCFIPGRRACHASRYFSPPPPPPSSLSSTQKRPSVSHNVFFPPEALAWQDQTNLYGIFNLHQHEVHQVFLCPCLPVFRSKLTLPVAMQAK